MLLNRLIRRGEAARAKAKPDMLAFDPAAGHYDQARRNLLPDFDAFYRAALSCLPRNRRQPLKVLDLGAGTGVFSKIVADAYPHSRIIVSDTCETLLAEARRKLGRDVRFEFKRLDVLIDPLPAGLDVVISSLAIHHFDHADKRAAFGSIYRALGHGGIFVNADQISTGSRTKDANLFEGWLQDVRQNGIKERDLKSALKCMKENDQNAPLDVQVRWLQEICFREVDVPYCNYFWAVISAVR